LFYAANYFRFNNNFSKPIVCKKLLFFHGIRQTEVALKQYTSLIFYYDMHTASQAGRGPTFLAALDWQRIAELRGDALTGNKQAP